MARRRHHEEHVNHEAWAIPYGDLITLLLAFFVVMYALSSVNEGKYRILSDSLVAAFRGAPQSLEPIQIGELSRSLQDHQVQAPRTLVPLEIESLFTRENDDRTAHEQEPDWGIMRRAGLSEEEIMEAAAQIEALSDEIGKELAGLVEADLVRLRQSRFWLEIEINTSLLFSTASAELSTESLPVVRRIAEILAPTKTRIQVEGHTDILSINTDAFPSNWELSAARAATVVRMFTNAAVEPARMAAVGFGEFQPISDNDTVAGRARNRRVTVVVVAAHEQRARDALGEPELVQPDLEREQPTIIAVTDSIE